jgi:hypothetical protein
MRSLGQYGVCNIPVLASMSRVMIAGGLGQSGGAGLRL